MPELPEVETIKRVIEPQIQGRSIENIFIRQPAVIAHPAAEEFHSQLIGQIISRMERRGKFLVFLLDSGDRIILHLRMTGCLLLTSEAFPEEPHTHLTFQLTGGRQLRYSDTRRCGRYCFLKKGETDTFSGIKKLGKEPFDPEFSSEYLMERLGKRKKAIKECLLEQKVIAGIGNIYSDEILFAARIHPARPASSLTLEEWQRLAAAIPERLSFFIAKNEISAEEYLSSKGKEYRNTPFLQVYGRKGSLCPICGECLQRMVIGGRSSVFCPCCQKL